MNDSGFDWARICLFSACMISTSDDLTLYGSPTSCWFCCQVTTVTHHLTEKATVNAFY